MFIGESKVILQLKSQLSKYAKTRLPILLEGESGTGKEISAEYIHQASQERGPFIAVNCGTLSEQLADSELFGHQRGAFTQAFETKAGLCQEANGGTLFLDEIGELPLPVQAKLLRFLDNGQIRPVGAVHYTHSDVRIIAATNRDLRHEIAWGRFRADLFHRLSVLQVRLPNLSEHPTDIPLLAEHFLQQQGIPKRFSPDALKQLAALPYPGNIRQLRNLVCQAALQTESELITAKDIPIQWTCFPQSSPSSTSIQSLQKNVLTATLQGRTYTQAARLLGIHRNTLRRWMLKYGYPLP